MKSFVKDPQAVLDYSLDWGPWLDGDELSNSDWSVVAGTISEVPATRSYTIQGITRVYIQGGALGENAILKNTITTAGGRTDERSLEIRIRQR
jgi:hypothetical protein